ncbi:septum site-determining protein MinC [Bacillus sp. FJAT-45350]|uniref:septum site-determining protein MinC n=1 Tax=Bacillus sp. FJAT-45350 TaxID=2011014 RepID=UPI000BB71AD4|nr:septum site-determining protein MinC [Bacillus sp. FJAT-45350]
MTQKKHHVTIKGTKDGLIFMLDDEASFNELLRELQDKLSSKHYQQDEGPEVQVNLAIGNRYLTNEQEEQLIELIENDRNLIVEEINSNVVTKLEAEELKKENQIVSVAKVIRSGQVLEITGDLLLIGDVNPGGTIKATGNIFVMGALRGIAHAGYFGNVNAVIAASVMAPAQLRIGDYISRSPDRHEQVDSDMDCAYIEDGKISIERLQQLSQLRPQLTRF